MKPTVLRRLGLAFGAALILSVQLLAATAPTIQFTDTRLKNGLRVIISEDHTAPVYSSAVLAAHARLDRGALVEARIVFTGVGTMPVRAPAAERVLTGHRPEGTILEEAARVAAAELDPPSDIHASAALRRHLAGVLLRRVMGRLGAA